MPRIREKFVIIVMLFKKQTNSNGMQGGLLYETAVNRIYRIKHKSKRNSNVILKLTCLHENSMTLHKQRCHLKNDIFLHVSTDQAVVGSQRRIVKTPVVQVILSGVNVPAWGQILQICILKLKCQTNWM